MLMIHVFADWRKFQVAKVYCLLIILNGYSDCPVKTRIFFQLLYSVSSSLFFQVSIHHQVVGVSSIKTDRHELWLRKKEICFFLIKADNTKNKYVHSCNVHRSFTLLSQIWGNVTGYYRVFKGKQKWSGESSVDLLQYVFCNCFKSIFSIQKSVPNPTQSQKWQCRSTINIWRCLPTLDSCGQDLQICRKFIANLIRNVPQGRSSLSGTFYLCMEFQSMWC